MTIASSGNQVTYTGDGVSVAFAYPYPFITTADIKVYFAGVLQTTGYTVAGVAPTGGSGTYQSGTVTFATAPTNLVAVLLYADPDLLQSTSLPPNDPFPSKTVEKMVDKVTLLIQRIYARFGNAIAYPVGETLSGILPAAASRLDRFVSFNATTGGAEVSSVTQTQVASAVAAAYAAGSTADAVSFIAVGAGTTSRTTQDKIRKDVPPSVVDYGAAVAVTCSTSVTAASTAGNEILFPAGAWVVTATPTVTGAKRITTSAGSTFTGAGATALGITNGAQTQAIQLNTAGTDFATHYIRRNANHAGGVAGFVSSGLRVDSNVTGTGATNYEWALTSVLYNYATAGQNVGAYLLGNKMASNSGPTWGAVIDLEELVATNNPTTQSIGLEVDLRSNGTDTGKFRVAVDVACTRQQTAGAATTTSYGVRVQSNRDGANSVISVAFGIDGPSTNVTVGFDTSLATISEAAFKMAAGQSIAFDASSLNKLNYDATGLGYFVSGTLKNRLNADGSLLLNVTGSALKIFGTASSGAATPTLGTNKPGAGGAPVTWLNFTLNGTQLWIPAWGA